MAGSGRLVFIRGNGKASLFCPDVKNKKQALWLTYFNLQISAVYLRSIQEQHWRKSSLDCSVELPDDDNDDDDDAEF